MTRSLHKQVTPKMRNPDRHDAVDTIRGTKIVGQIGRNPADASRAAQPYQHPERSDHSFDLVLRPRNLPAIGQPCAPVSGPQSSCPLATITQARGSERLNKAGMEGPVEQSLSALLDFNS